MAANPNVPTIDNPLADVEALAGVCRQLKTGVESLGGHRGGPLDRAATLREVQNATGPAGPQGPPGAPGAPGPPGVDFSGGGTMTGPLVVHDTGAVYSATQIYHMAYPPAVFNDASEGVQYVGTTYGGTQRAGIAGYVVTDFAVNPGVGWGNGVAVMGVAVAHANGANAWGINTLLTDSDNPTVPTSGTGRKLLNEFDFNVTSAQTETYGIAVGGASIAQPVVAEGFVVNRLGTNIHWQTGFISTNGAAHNGMVLGLQDVASGANANGQPIILENTDGGGSMHSAVIQAQANNTLQIFGDTNLEVHIQGNLHVSGTIGTLAALADRVAALEARLAAAGL